MSNKFPDKNMEEGKYAGSGWPPFRPQRGDGTLQSAASVPGSLPTKRTKSHFAVNYDPKGDGPHPGPGGRPPGDSCLTGQNGATCSVRAARPPPPGASAPAPAAARSCRRASRRGAGRPPSCLRERRRRQKPLDAALPNALAAAAAQRSCASPLSASAAVLPGPRADAGSRLAAFLPPGNGLELFSGAGSSPRFTPPREWARGWGPGSGTAPGGPGWAASLVGWWSWRLWQTLRGSSCDDMRLQGHSFPS
ncbi:uncharacterized protein ACIB01_001994 [Guaruba guarouba]